MANTLDWEFFDLHGSMPLGPMVTAEEVTALRTRADDLALGHFRNNRVVIQRDTGGSYEDLPSAEPQSEEGSLCYRKINGLESDELFSVLLRHPLCDEIFRKIYGHHAGMSTFRAMVMNKPAHQGTELPWHQDGGTVWQLDRDPLMTVWIALDDATKEKGCVEVVTGSHHLGLLSTYGSTITEKDAYRHCAAPRRRYLELPAGHGFLLHNWLIHRSGTNQTGDPRRAFTACFMDARTTNLLTGDYFPLVRGPQWPVPHFLEQLRLEREELGQSAQRSEEYALSLRAALNQKELELQEFRESGSQPS